MSTIVTRTGKGSPLTIAEMDANFTNLNNDKIQISGSPTSGQAVVWNGTSWVPGSAGATLTDDTTTNASFFVALSNSSSGSYTTAYVSSSGLFFNPSTGTLNSTTFNSLSDENFKKNINKIEGATEIVNGIDGVEFEWVSNNNKSSGVIAQQLEKILPHLVEDNDGTKTVNYSGLIGYLIESVKEMDARIKELENAK